VGTNHYLHRNVCPYCQRGTDQIHIGKDSAGWCYGLHVYPNGLPDQENRKITCLDDWEAYLYQRVAEGDVLRDEYHQDMTVADWVDLVVNRKWDRPLDDVQSGRYTYKVGPNGCLRHPVDGTFCIGHGDGPWDYLVGTFS